MPRRRDAAETKRQKAAKRSRGAYRPDQRAALDRVEAKRRRLAITLAALAERCGLSERTLRRAMKSGRAWPRQVRALQFTLRTIERELDTEKGVLE